MFDVSAITLYCIFKATPQFADRPTFGQGTLVSSDCCCHTVESALFTAPCYAERGIAMASCLFVRPSVRVCLSVCDVEVSWSYRLEFLENNFTDDQPNLFFPLSASANITDLL